MKQFTLKVHNIKKETKDAITICFKQPSLKKIKYRAGQYLTLSFRINGRKYVRPYSFSSAPSIDSFLETTIKRVPNGVFSNYVNDNLQIGDIVEVMEPMGDFVHTYDETTTHLYFWGVGSGITPLISIIKEVLVHSNFVELNLVYGNKNFESTIFLDLINDLLKQYSEKLKVWHFHSQYNDNQSHNFVKKGRISKEFILDLLQNVDLDHTKHYICGPTNLKTTIKETLSFLKCPVGNIFSEDFELVRNPKDFENIFTQIVKIHCKGIDTSIVVEKGKSILEAALDSDVELPYSCQTGNCSTCKGKLITGEMQMIGLSKERNDLNPEDYLLCCSHPLTENVYIEI